MASGMFCTSGYYLRFRVRAKDLTIAFLAFHKFSIHFYFLLLFYSYISRKNNLSRHRENSYPHRVATYHIGNKYPLPRVLSPKTCKRLSILVEKRNSYLGIDLSQINCGTSLAPISYSQKFLSYLFS